ncbi:uncharacterized protein HMPREF1541_08181 [Cyphellophora europaea CBS 101466]|uniref:Calpain catalytic domain-containing protein n=1 Tax=Cyphellophora europaea (strain CBS 101466) TaxID=1220924 RepID=W2RL15_CYPE1|nr:uncharacterized protein HMPREF1541_08181 [Cyphellophora europaea CBS 101466]ETN37191.1 hypothetical protein HMPREF1541_08181 [Cyphellophora europaea CBS 101466]
MSEHGRSWSGIEARAKSVERTIDLKTNTSAALKATIETAELYMQALRLADTPTDRKRIDARCKDLINKAEVLKAKQDGSVSNGVREVPLLKPPVSPRKLTTRENIILLEGSKLNGFLFKPWDKEPADEEFALNDGEDPFIDLPELPLSDIQLESFDGWKRPNEALSSMRFPGASEGNEVCMTTRQISKIDLVQDLTSDCSVVASLCAGSSRVGRGHQMISSTFVYPWDYKEHTFGLSPNGKYILKFYFNGCWRRVVIDDRLPTSKTSRVLHVVDRTCPGRLWPTLVEKAYLKVRGGYDFPGSNSGTDLAVITGWIPQQVFLHDDDVDSDSLWKELFDATTEGHSIITVGTGKLSRREQKQLGLAAEHDYAVLEMKERGGVKELLVKNPWMDGDVWKGASRRRPNPNSETDPETAPEDDSNDMVPGTFWMDFNSVFQHFENLYINWNPGLFSHRHDRHFSWTLPKKRPAANILDDHHQLVVQATRTSEVWILLNRHFRNGDYSHANSGKNGYIALYIFDKQGRRVLSREGASTRGPFVDSPNTLVRFSATAHQPYTVAVLQSDLPPGKHNFTISLFSHCPATLEEAIARYPHARTLSAQWTRSTAGGSSDSPHYLSNPQFSLTLHTHQPIACLLRIVDDGTTTLDTTDIHVKLAILSSDGRRITRLRTRDVVAHSGDYRRGSAVIEKALAPGKYTVIASTFDAGQLAKFTLDFYSSEADAAARSSFERLPGEESGKLLMRVPPAVFERGLDRMLLPLTVRRVNKVVIIARQVQRSSTSSLFKMSLEQGQGPYKRTVADSAFDEEEFHAVGTGLRIDDVDLRPEMHAPGSGGLWLVLERLARGTEQGREAEVLQVDILAEEAVDIGAWGRGQG